MTTNSSTGLITIILSAVTVLYTFVFHFYTDTSDTSDMCNMLLYLLHLTCRCQHLTCVWSYLSETAWPRSHTEGLPLRHYWTPSGKSHNASSALRERDRETGRQRHKESLQRKYNYHFKMKLLWCFALLLSPFIRSKNTCLFKCSVTGVREISAILQPVFDLHWNTGGLVSQALPSHGPLTDSQDVNYLPTFF